LLNEPPKHEAATLKGHNKEPKAPKAEKTETAAVPQAEAPAGGKARPVEFHLAAAEAKKVELYGAFIVRGNGRKKMARQSDGTWTLTLYLTPNTYKYHFLVDGKKTLDPGAEKRGGNSVMTVGAQ
jgi:1,4-alpha-glucan branching enzyme